MVLLNLFTFHVMLYHSVQYLACSLIVCVDRMEKTVDFYKPSLLSMIIVLLFMIRPCAAQACQPFAGMPSICAGLINYPVWLPPATSQASLADALISSGVLASTLLPGNCARAMVVMACSLTFRACGSDELPLPLCSDFCDRGASDCGAASVSTTWNCTNAVDPVLAPARLWQAYTNRTGVPESCAVANVSTPGIICPTPFIMNNATDQCVMKCPPPSLDDSSVNHKTILIALIGGSISVVCALLMLHYLAWLSIQRKQINYMFNVWLAIFISAVGDVVPKWQSSEEIMCSDSYTLRRRSSGVCVLTTFTGFWARQAIAYWTMFAIYRVYEILYRVNWTRALKPENARFGWLTENLVFSLIAWGFPTVQFLIVLAGDWITTASPYGCSVDTSPHGGWMYNGVTLLPLTIVEVITTIFVVSIVVKILATGARVATEHWSTVALCSIYAFAAWYIIIFAWYTFRIRDRFTERVVEFIQCSTSTDGESNACHYRSAVSVNWQLSVIAFTSFYPVLMFIISFGKGPLQLYRVALTGKRSVPISVTSDVQSTSL